MTSYPDFSNIYPHIMQNYRKELDVENLPERFSAEEFDKTCSELKLEKQTKPSLKDFIHELNLFFPSTSNPFDDSDEPEEYRYIFNLDTNEISDVINVENFSNKCIRISNIDYVIDAETNTIHIRTKDYINLFSLEELKDKVTEYRKSYKLLKNSLKLLKMEKDF